MLDDRPYMRPEEPRFRGPSMQQPWTGWAILLTINVVVFLLQVLIDPNSLSTHMATFEKRISKNDTVTYRTKVRIRSTKIAELYELEMLGRKIGLISGPKTPGRKPKNS